MPIINHVSYNDKSDLEAIITQNGGSPLYGEIDMFRRIFADCNNSEHTWHFWHDLRLPIPVKGQKEIQIDFLLVCEKGAVIVEVKGGRIGIEQGMFYYEVSRERSYMDRTAFEQGDDYKYALMNNRIISTSQLFIETICAFPHTRMEHTNANPHADLGHKLWSKYQHDDPSVSFSDFCCDVIDKDKNSKSLRLPELNPEEVKVAIKSLLFNFSDRTQNVYSERKMEAILERLNIDNLSSFKSLQKNDRLFIEGGPGTGKTTIAKAYIEKYHTLRGLYLCWNKLLEAKIKNEIWQSGLANCQVEQFASFVFSLQKKVGLTDISLEDITNGLAYEKLDSLFSIVRQQDDFVPYDYVIIDEAQDVLDKGAIQILNSLSSVTQAGITSGRYLVFYDTEQGYDYQSRHISDIADSIALNGARFVLDTNKRVPTNKEIVSFANSLLDGVSVDELFARIIEDNYDSVKVICFDGAKTLIKHITAIKKDIRENAKRWNDYVILADSSSKKEQVSETERLYDRIATIDGIKELSVRNVCSETDELPFTSILSYKGLESKHVVLVINGRTPIDTFELYIGMTRAIIDLQILILK